MKLEADGELEPRPPFLGSDRDGGRRSARSKRGCRCGHRDTERGREATGGEVARHDRLDSLRGLAGEPLLDRAQGEAVERAERTRGREMEQVFALVTCARTA